MIKMTIKNENRCDECGGKIISDVDTRGYEFCEKCGLVKDPTHPHDARHHGLDDKIELIYTTATFEGLRTARLLTAKLEK
jgi:tRNA(Ile2) C34 agmatinyltransferase TiaS